MEGGVGDEAVGVRIDGWMYLDGLDVGKCRIMSWI